MQQGSKGLSIVSYITWIGWIIALLARDKSDTLVIRHLNQALILNLATTVATILTRINGFFAIIGWVIDVAVLVFWIWGIVRAIKGSEEPLPLIGGINIIS